MSARYPLPRRRATARLKPTDWPDHVMCKQKAGVTQRVPGAAPHEKIASHVLNQIGLLYNGYDI